MLSVHVKRLYINTVLRASFSEPGVSKVRPDRKSRPKAALNQGKETVLSIPAVVGMGFARGRSCC